jgi:hypothetical protein
MSSRANLAMFRGRGGQLQAYPSQISIPPRAYQPVQQQKFTVTQQPQQFHAFPRGVPSAIHRYPAAPPTQTRPPMELKRPNASSLANAKRPCLNNVARVPLKQAPPSASPAPPQSSSSTPAAAAIPSATPPETTVPLAPPEGPEQPPPPQNESATETSEETPAEVGPPRFGPSSATRTGPAAPTTCQPQAPDQAQAKPCPGTVKDMLQNNTVFRLNERMGRIDIRLDELTKKVDNHKNDSVEKYTQAHSAAESFRQACSQGLDSLKQELDSLRQECLAQSSQFEKYKEDTRKQIEALRKDFSAFVQSSRTPGTTAAVASRQQDATDAVRLKQEKIAQQAAQAGHRPPNTRVQQPRLTQTQLQQQQPYAVAALDQYQPQPQQQGMYVHPDATSSADPYMQFASIAPPQYSQEILQHYQPMPDTQYPPYAHLAAPYGNTGDHADTLFSTNAYTGFPVTADQSAAANVSYAYGAQGFYSK